MLAIGSYAVDTFSPSSDRGSRVRLTPGRRLLFVALIASLALPIGVVAEVSYRVRRGIPLFPEGPRARGGAASDGAAAMDFDDAHYYEIFERVPDPELLYTPKPGVTRGAVSINSHGFRDREYPVEKPANTFRIVVLGDSIVWGHRLAIDDVFAKQLERMLNAEASGERAYEVLNFGVSGYSARQEVGIYRARAAVFQPDLVILGLCVNDEYYSSVEGDFLDDGSGALFRKSFLLEHAQMSFIELLRDRVPALAARFRHTVDVRAHLTELARLRGGSRSLIVIFPVLESFAPYRDGASHERLRAAAAGLPFAVHDLLPDFRGVPAQAYRVDPNDVIHPNRLGNEVAARATLAALHAEKLLPGDPG